jgi:hypothetical protein
MKLRSCEATKSVATVLPGRWNANMAARRQNTVNWSTTDETGEYKTHHARIVSACWELPSEVEKTLLDLGCWQYSSSLPRDATDIFGDYNHIPDYNQPAVCNNFANVETTHQRHARCQSRIDSPKIKRSKCYHDATAFNNRCDNNRYAENNRLGNDKLT